MSGPSPVLQLSACTTLYTHAGATADAAALPYSAAACAGAALTREDTGSVLVGDACFCFAVYS